MKWPVGYRHEADVAALHEEDDILSVYTCETCSALVSGSNTDAHREWHEELHALIQMAGQGISIKFTEEDHTTKGSA